MRFFVLATSLLAALAAATAPPAAAQSERSINFAAAARAVSLCYTVKMGWTPRQAAVFSYQFLKKEGVPVSLAWGNPTAEVKALADYMYTRLDDQCDFRRSAGGITL
jgi:ABC-type nitrate/sulfonate/bicarbonate transport system substrate-binding protein